MSSPKQQYKTLKQLEGDAFRRLDRRLKQLDIESTTYRTLHILINRHCLAYAKADRFFKIVEAAGLILE